MGQCVRIYATSKSCDMSQLSEKEKSTVVIEPETHPRHDRSNVSDLGFSPPAQTQHGPGTGNWVAGEMSRKNDGDPRLS